MWTSWNLRAWMQSSRWRHMSCVWWQQGFTSQQRKMHWKSKPELMRFLWIFVLSKVWIRICSQYKSFLWIRWQRKTPEIRNHVERPCKKWVGYLRCVALTLLEIERPQLWIILRLLDLQEMQRIPLFGWKQELPEISHPSYQKLWKIYKLQHLFVM